MNKYITLLIIIFLAIVIEPLFYRKTHMEGFNNFNTCLNKGFTKEFCIQTPVSFRGSNICRCNNGMLGQIIPGWITQCICPATINL